jgi:hypothetical protein
MPTFRTRSQINFRGPVVIQMGALAGNQLGNNIPADTNLVYEHGMWKYPQLASTGAVVVPYGVRLAGVVANLGASTAWTLMLAGNAANISGEPYAAIDAALYVEPTLQLGGATGQYVYLEYPSSPLPLLSPGQRVYMTTAAGTAPMVRFVFKPE